jgi:hypothetical protein
LGVDVDGDGVAFDVGLDGEVREELERHEPGFEGAVLLAQDYAALSGYGEGLLGFGVLTEDWAFGAEFEAVDGMEMGSG